MGKVKTRLQALQESPFDSDQCFGEPIWDFQSENDIVDDILLPGYNSSTLINSYGEIDWENVNIDFEYAYFNHQSEEAEQDLIRDYHMSGTTQ